jgi:hypothetical protein
VSESVAAPLAQLVIAAASGDLEEVNRVLRGIPDLEKASYMMQILGLLIQTEEQRRRFDGEV